MSWVKVYTHAVFSTKNRQPLLTDRIRQEVFQHIKENAKNKDIFIDHIGGYRDHVHCLISLNKELSISKTMQLIKGESSFWINRMNLISDKFAWQDDYWIVGLGESQLVSIRKYIRNQEQHHQKIGFETEVEILMKKYGWSLIKD